jgi:hypothetical protein
MSLTESTQVEFYKKYIAMIKKYYNFKDNSYKLKVLEDDILTL